MKYNYRTVQFAYDIKLKKVIDADEIFDKNREGFDYRKKYNEDKVEPYCLECGNKLFVSSSKWDNIHFKHFSEDYCLLKDGYLTPKEKNEFNNVYKSKESDRHKFLKNEIGDKLKLVEGVSDVIIDEKFIYEGVDKRRPDVYCKYFDKKIVFEIQLSQLSQRYILSRYNFYRSKGIFLIWILDNFDVLGQTQTEKDIKYGIMGKFNV